MKKRLFSILLSICMVLTMMPMAGGGVFAQTSETTEHKHCVCGATHKTIGDHKAEDIKKFEATDSLPTTAGYYYLTENVTITSTWEPVNGTVLCLNGKTIRMNAAGDAISVGKGETFILTDCTEAQGSITHGTNLETKYTGRGMNVAGTFTMYGGNITGNIESNSEDVFGAGVYLARETGNDSSVPNFTMNGGSIAGNILKKNHSTGISGGGGVYIDANTIFTINGGSIKDNMTVDGNYTAGLHGGGVYARGTVYMNGGNIINNKSGRGAGVYIYPAANFYMSSGSINNNEANYSGGGVYIAEKSDQGDTTFEMSGGSITGNAVISNLTSSNGGGVYNAASIKISGNVQIAGNLKKKSEQYAGTANNLYPSEIATINGAIGNDANIGVSAFNTPEKGKPVTIIDAYDTDYSKYFHSDNELYKACYDTSDKKIKLKLLLSQSNFKFADNTVTKTYGESFTNAATGAAKGSTVTYSSSNKKVATVDNDGAITATGAGTAVITATASETDDYKEATASYNLIVNKRTAVAGDFDFTRPADLTYDGNPKTAQVALDSKYTGCGDITVKYYDESGNQIEAVNAGTYKVKIDIAEGENFASVNDLEIGTFTVAAKELKESMIETIDAQTYTGNTITPVVTVTGGGRTLVEGTDYDVAYTKNTNAGTGEVTVTGKGNYSGAVTKPFAISAKQEADVIAPEIRVLAGESREVDLSSYKKNDMDKIGSAHTYDNVFDRSIPPHKVQDKEMVGFTVKSDAAAGDSGIITVGVDSADGNTYYDIKFKVTVRSKSSGGTYKPPVQKPSITAGEGFKAELSSDGTKATITVEEGYEIVDVLVNGISKGKVTEITGLKTGDTIEVKTEKKQTEPVKPADNKHIIRGVKNTEIELEITVNKDGNIVIKWKKSKGYRVDSFEILRAVKKNGKYSKIYTTKSGKASRIVNAKNLKDGKRYYYKVRGVRTIDGKKYYTEWSDIESEKVNK